jgi:GNAT superfamily N-acetyltransferase
MIVTRAIARRIEDAEIAVHRAVASAAPSGFWQPFGDGAASFVRHGSPMNKVIGAGLDTRFTADDVAALEDRYRACDERARFELATLGVPANATALTARGYRLLGFENVLVRPLPIGHREVAGTEVRRVDTETTRVWRDTYIDAAAANDDTGAGVDQFSRQVIVDALDDDLAAGTGDRYLAYVQGRVAGVASMLVHGRIALLGGSATLPSCRRRGVHTALIAARLTEAGERGCDLAAITAAPGSRSEANAVRHGFALAYARAILAIC